jgi:hypothetical protein
MKSTVIMSIVVATLSLVLMFGPSVQAQTNGKDSISFKTILQAQSYSGSNINPIPAKSNFVFGASSPICPTNNCKQEFIDAFYSTSSPESPSVQGTLKIENKTTSTASTIKYSLIPFAGNFQATGMEEDRKTGHSITMFAGDFGLGGTNTIYAATTPEFKYRVSGTFDNTTKILTFQGIRNTS